MKKHIPHVSVVIVNFNGKRHLRTLFGSLEKTVYPRNRLELIMIDNGSNDGSAEFTKKNYRRVKIIGNDINNYCKALNIGIANSRGEFVALINTDTKVDKRWLVELIEVITKDPTIAAVGSKLLTFDGKIQNAGHYMLPNFYWGERGAGLDAKNFNEIDEVPSICGAAVLYRKSCLKKIGLFDEDFIMYGEDVDIALRLRKKGWKLIFVPNSKVFHKFHGSGNEEHARFYIERNRLLFLAKHNPEKLSNALLGQGYFTAKKEPRSFLKLYSVLPEVVSKLIKHNNLKVAEKTMRDLLGELNGILHYEYDFIRNELIEKDAELGKLMFDQEQLNAQLHEKQKEVEDKDKTLNDRYAELERIKNELRFVNDLFRQKSDELLLRDGQLIEKDAELVEKDAELGKLMFDQEQLNAHLHEKQKEVEDKDKMLNELTKELNAQLHEKQKEVEDKDKMLKELTKELNGVYGSEGYRFILRPFWTILWNIKKSCGFFRKKINSFLWLTVSILLLPLFKLVFIFSCLERFFSFIFRFFSRDIHVDRKVIPFEHLKISIVIPSWNGIDLLNKCLESIYALDEFKNDANEVLVVDDASTDGTSDFIKKNFVRTRVIRNKKNMGFGWTCNRGVNEARNELIVLINNDIIVTKDFLKPLKEHLRDENVFAVTPKLYGWDRKTFLWGMHMGRIEDDYIRLWNEADSGNGDRIKEASPSIFAIGGAMVFRKQDFLWLGGFDEIYRPNCWEDIDISYRAWKRGLKVIYEPASLLYHKGKATLSYERHKEIKNELSFMWKNITDIDLLDRHLGSLSRLLYKHRLPFLKGFLWALRYLPKTLAHRFSERRYICVEDKKIMDLSMNYYRNFIKNNFKHRSKNDKKNILLITPFIPYSLNTGGKIRIHTLAKLLKDRYNIFLLTLIDREDETKFIPELKSVFKEIYTVYPRTAIPDNMLYPHRYRFAYSQYLIDKLKDIQRDLPLDIIQIESNELLYLTKFTRHVPVVYTEHDISILTFNKSYYRHEGNVINSFIDYLKRRHFHHSVYRNIDKVIALSKKDKEIIESFFAWQDVSLLTTGVDLEKFSFSRNKEKAPKLIFVGNYLHYPNEDAIVYFSKDIFPFIKRSMPDVKLMIVGSNPTNKVKLLTKEDHNIILVGEVEDVAPYLQEAAVFINPIRLSAGIKGKVLEAMAKGVPVVSTQVGFHGIESMKNRDLLVAHNEIEFADHAISLLTDKNFSNQIAANARKLVEDKYDWKKLACELGDIYKDTTYDFKALFKKRKFSASNNKLHKIIEATNIIVENAINDTSEDIVIVPEDGPDELHIELNYDCNCKCIMCDLWDHNKRNRNSENKVKQVSLEDIKKIVKDSKSLRMIKTVVLSGGEPFLNKDFVEICRFFITHFPGISIGVLSNFFNPELTMKKMRQVLDGVDAKRFWLGTSIDGLGKMHDRIRGARGAFSNLKKTIKLCRKEFPGIDLCATFTITPYNAGQLIAARRFAEKAGLGFLPQFVVPKEARGEFKWRESELNRIQEDIYRIIDRLVKTEEGKGVDVIESIEASRDTSLISMIYYLSNLVRYQDTKKRFFSRCVSGAKFAMVSPHGELFFCPGLKDKVIGNVKDERFDYLWISDEAEAKRTYIQMGHCHCWLVCMVLPVIEKMLELAKRRKKLDISVPVASTEEQKVLQERNISLNNSEYQDKDIVLRSTPRGVGVGMHYSCNADCVFCIGKSNSRHVNASLEIYKRFFEKKLHNVLSNAEYINFCGFGEMLLMPKAVDFLEYINKRAPLANKIITTNGIPLTNKVCDIIAQSRYNIQISLLASHAGLHKKLTRTDNFDKIIRQIKYMRSMRPDHQRASMSLVSIINTLNIEDLPEFVRLAHYLGVDEVICNYMIVYTKAHLKLSCFFKQEITDIKLQEAEDIARDLNINIKLPPRFSEERNVNNGKAMCAEPWQYFYVEREGSVLPCCYAGDHIDHLNAKDFDSVWNGEEYQRLRRSLVDGTPNPWCEFCYKNANYNISDIRAHVSLNPGLQKEILGNINFNRMNQKYDNSACSVSRLG